MAKKNASSAKTDQARATRETASDKPKNVSLAAAAVAIAPPKPAVDEDFDPSEFEGDEAEAADAPLTAVEEDAVDAPASDGGMRSAVREYNKLVRELGPVRMQSLLLKRMAVRLQRMLNKIAEYEYPLGELPEELRKAIAEDYTDAPPTNAFAAIRETYSLTIASFEKAQTVLNTIPKEWRHVAHRGRTAAAAPVEFTPNQLVEVRAGARKKYEGEPVENLTGLSVVATVGTKVKVRTAAGEVVYFARNELTVASRAA